MQKKQLMFLILLVFLIRIAYIIFCNGNKPFHFNDEPGYDQIAINLIQKKGFFINIPEMFISNSKPTAMREPLYPIFLAGCYKIFGHNLLIVKILQAGVDCITAVFIYLISQQIFSNRSISLLAVFLFAIYIPEVTFVPRLLQITFFTMTLVIFIYSLLKSQENPSFRNFLLAGLLLGISILSKATVQFFIIFLFFWIIFKFRKNKKLFLNSILAISIGVILSITPWSLRNYFLFKAFIPGSTAGGYNLFIGNDFKTQGAAFTLLPSMIDESLKKELLKSNEHEQDLIFRHEALKRIKNEPQKFIFLSIKKFFRFWFNLGYGRPSSLNSYMVAGLNFLLIILSVAGFFKRPEAFRKALPIFLLILYFTLFHMVVVAGVHYMIPIAPLLIIFSSAGFLSFPKNPLNREEVKN